MGDIYDAETYEPRKSVGHLLHRVRTEILAAVDREFAADEALSAMEVTSAQFGWIKRAQLAVKGWNMPGTDRLIVELSA